MVTRTPVQVEILAAVGDPSDSAGMKQRRVDEPELPVLVGRM
jgi:hypothetical protein